MTATSLSVLNDSVFNAAPMANVKNPDMDERMVELATVVYASEALVAQLAANQRMQKVRLICAISRCVNGISSGLLISDPCSSVDSEDASVSRDSDESQLPYELMLLGLEEDV